MIHPNSILAWRSLNINRRMRAVCEALERIGHAATDREIRDAIDPRVIGVGEPLVVRVADARTPPNKSHRVRLGRLQMGESFSRVWHLPAVWKSYVHRAQSPAPSFRAAWYPSGLPAGRRGSTGLDFALCWGQRMTTYAIKDWEQRFCVSQGKRVFRWSWVALPINPNGEHYRILMETPEGREAYCVFMGLLGVAANGEPRGVLADRSGALSIRAIHYRIGIAEDVVAKAIQILSGPDIGWLVPVQLGARSEHARSTLGDEPPANGSKTARSTLGARSETHYTTPPNPTQQDKTSQNKTPQAEEEDDRVASARVWAGVEGWDNPTKVASFLTNAGISKVVANRLATHARILGSTDIPAEWARIKANRSIANPQGALVKLLAGIAGVDLDTRSIVGTLQDIVNQKRSERA